MSRMLAFPFRISLALLVFGAVAVRADEPTAKDWALRLAESELRRRGDSLHFVEGRVSKWDYTSGIFAFALQTAGERWERPDLSQAGSAIVTSFVTSEGKIRTFKREDFNLDNVTPGRALLWAWERQPTPPLRQAIEVLRDQVAHQPRTVGGGFWHKQRYPEQMWLDGLYMASPFLARYGTLMSDTSTYDEVARQILLIDQNLYSARTGLYFHAWDASRQQTWADPATGLSPNFWARAVGWFGMAVVDVLDELPPTHPQVDAVNHILHRVADGIVRHQDPASGVWYQIMDQPGLSGNYREASATAMFVYTLAKGINRGYLAKADYGPALERAYAGLVKEFLRQDATGAVSLIQVCEVAGLGFTTSKGRPRDGSVAYYLSEPVVANDLKGVGPCLLACLEMDRYQRGPAIPAPSSAAEKIAQTVVLPRIGPGLANVTQYGAIPEGRIDVAVAKAVQTLASGGGGRLTIPAGRWLSGPIHLRSGVELHLEEGATIEFVTDPAAYLPAVFTRWEGVECYNYSPLIYAIDCQDVAVTGKGTLDGAAAESNWWAWKKTQKADRDRLFALGEQGVPVEERRFGEGSLLRPGFLQFYRCERVLVEGVTLLRSPMWLIHPVLSQDVTIRGVKAISHGPNSDGCDPESSRRVLIEDCLFDTGDDCIAIKSGRNNDGRRLNVPSEDIVIRRCVMKDGHGGVVIGSEISGGARNIHAENLVLDSPNLDRALRIKSNARRGGVIEHVSFRDSKIGKVSEAVLTIDLLYEEGSKGEFPPVVRHLNLERLSASASPRVLWVAGFEGAVVDRITISDSDFSGLTEPDLIHNARRISYDNVEVRPLKRVKSQNSVADPLRP